MITFADFRDFRSSALDDAGTLVAEYAGEHIRHAALASKGEVGVANAGGFDADEAFFGAKRVIKIDFGIFKAGASGGGKESVCQHCGKKSKPSKSWSYLGASATSIISKAWLT